MNAKLTGTRGGRWAKPAALVGAGVLAGTVVGLGVTANASTTTPTANPSTSATNGTADNSGAGIDGQNAPRPPRGNETPLTGDDLAKATAAAKAAVPGATVERAETDADGGVYEVHMTKADGTHVRVGLDKDFKVTGVDSRGPGQGGPGPGGPGHDGPGHDGPRGPKGTPLTGTDLTKATEAAESAVSDGTLKFAVKEADGTYTAFLEKTDGTHVRVTLDKDFKVTGQAVDNGPGRDGGRGRGGHHGTPLTGADLTKATAAAKSKVAGATVRGAVKESDGTYSVFIAKSDGTPARVTLDKDFKATGVENAPARGGHHGGRGPGGPGDLPPMPGSDAPAPGASTGSTGGPLTGATESSSYAA